MKAIFEWNLQHSLNVHLGISFKCGRMNFRIRKNTWKMQFQYSNAKYMRFSCDHSGPGVLPTGQKSQKQPNVSQKSLENIYVYIRRHLSMKPCHDSKKSNPNPYTNSHTFQLAENFFFSDNHINLHRCAVNIIELPHIPCLAVKYDFSTGYIIVSLK